MPIDLELLVREHAEREDRDAPPVTAAEATLRARALDSATEPFAVAEPAPPVTRRHLGRRRASIAVAAVAAVVVGVVAIVNRGAPRPSGPATGVQTTAPAVETSAPGWSRLPAGPLSQVDPVLVWTGTKLFLVGGNDALVSRASQATSYDPTSGTWEVLPDAPIAVVASYSGHAVWDGSEIIVLATDGTGAAYDPNTGQWRRIANAPFTMEELKVAVWSGHEVLAWASSQLTPTTAPVTTGAAAYDPVTDRWRRLDAGPLDTNTALGLWTGTELVLLGWQPNGPYVPFPPGRAHTAAAYDPESDRWRELPAPPFNVATPALPIAAVITDGGIVAWNAELHAGRLDRVTGEWQPVADLPLQPLECYPQGVLAGSAVVAYHCGQVAILQDGASLWNDVPQYPLDEAPRSAVAAGDRVIAWSALALGPDNAPPGGWVLSLSTVPDTIGMTLEGAQQAMHAAGFEASAYERDPQAPESRVVAQEPPAGLHLPVGLPVGLRTAP